MTGQLTEGDWAVPFNSAGSQLETGARLRAVRRRMGWRQQDAAAITGLSRAQIARAESGRSDLREEAIHAFASVVADRGGLDRTEIVEFLGGRREWFRER